MLCLKLLRFVASQKIAQRPAVQDINPSVSNSYDARVFEFFENLQIVDRETHETMASLLGHWYPVRNPHHLGRERLRLIEQAHQPRFELVGQEVPDRTHIQDWRRALVETGAHDIQQPVSFSHLGAADHHDPLVLSGVDRPLHRNDVGREPGIPRARKT